MLKLLTPQAAASRLHIVPALLTGAEHDRGAERYVYELARHMADTVPT